MLLDSRTWISPLRQDLKRVAAVFRAAGRFVAAAATWIVATRTDLLELGFVLLMLGGVALIHLPTAIILGGTLGVFACERRPKADAKRSKVPEPRSERIS